MYVRESHPYVVELVVVLDARVVSVHLVRYLHVMPQGGQDGQGPARLTASVHRLTAVLAVRVGGYRLVVAVRILVLWGEE